MSNPLLIGITGGIGSGKTTIAEIFSLIGIPVYYADIRAREIMAQDADLINKIKENFGEAAYINSEVNRQYLAEKVFSSEEETQKINALIHPAVAQDFSKWIEERQDSPYLLKEAALLFETGSYKHLDATILVTAPLQLRIARILKRDAQRSLKQVEDIIERQLSVSSAQKLADYIIPNDESTLIIPKVLDLHQTLITKIG